MAIKSYQRVLLLLLLALLLTCLLSPWAAAFWNLVLDFRPDWELPDYPFSRIFDRVFMVVGVILFSTFLRRLGISSPKQLGLTPLRQGYTDLLLGFFLALASMIALVLAMTAVDIFMPQVRYSFSRTLQIFLSALLSAIAVGVLEEIFFRGIIFQGLVEDWRPGGAILATSLFYSVVHFVSPAEKIPLSGLQPLAGVRHLIYAFRVFLDPAPLLPGICGLFLIGFVLCYAYLRSGSLYLSIGLHAGWVFGLKSTRIFGDYSREALGWLFGSSDPGIVSGVAGWTGILTVGVVVHWMTRKRQGWCPAYRSIKQESGSPAKD